MPQDKYTEAWIDVAHHVDAYLGFPDVQESILEERVAELAHAAAHMEVKQTVLTTYVPVCEPISLHVARSNPEGKRVEALATLVATDTELHLTRLHEALPSIRLDQVDHAELAVNALVNVLGNESEDAQLLSKAWKERQEELARFKGRLMLVKLAKVG
jgi:hypothetical protein